MLASSARRLAATSMVKPAHTTRHMSSALNQFSDEEKMLKESVKKWAESELKPHVRRMDAEKKMVG